MSHRHYCPDEATCRERDPCCLWSEGDCLCDFENMCRGAARPTYAVVEGQIVEVPAGKGPDAAAG